MRRHLKLHFDISPEGLISNYLYFWIQINFYDLLGMF